MPKLKQWRQVAGQNGVQIFVFSMIREPLSTYVSGFNYFKVQNKRQAPSEKNFLDYLQQNPNIQCQFFLGMRCHSGYDTETRMMQLEAVMEAVDWMTPMPQLSSELLPLLAYMTNLSNRNADVVVQPKRFGPVPKRTLSITELSSDAIAQLKAGSTIDQALYTLVEQRYDFARMREFLTRKGAFSASVKS